MKDVYRTWPKSFSAGLDFVRAKDDNLLTHPIYTRRSAELFKMLSAEILDLLATEPPFSFSGITRDSLESYYESGLSGIPELDFIIATSKKLCSALRVSEPFYDNEAQAFCLYVVQGNEMRAMKCLHRLIRPAVMLFRIRDSAHFTGMRGGKPTHRLYDVTMMLCREFMQEHPDAGPSEIARGVRRKLEVNYSHLPAVDSIRRWLRNF